MAKNRIAHVLALGLGVAVGLVVAGGCASTEYFNEGPGQPTDRASGAVPPGELGVCKRPNTHRPLIVSEKLWADTRECTPKTPVGFLRLGFGSGEPNDNQAASDAEQQKLMTLLKDGQNETTGNSRLVAYLRALHEFGLKDPRLKDHVMRDSARPDICDYTYLLNTMNRERAKLAEGTPNSKCTAEAYDTQIRGQGCLFDSARDEAVWLTSSWSCVAHTNALGESQSCYRLCAYDDYCAKQVTCSAPDIDLLLCAMGVCVPEAKAGIY